MRRAAARRTLPPTDSQPRAAAPDLSKVDSKPQALSNSETVHDPQHSPNVRAQTNRANAQHSTGPRTIPGKLASSRNSFKHGLASAQLIIPGEDPASFDRLLAALLDEHQPANVTEEILVQEIAQSYWLSQRAIRFQNQCFAPEGVDQKQLALFMRYQTTHERAFHKSLSALMRLKKDRARGFVSQSGQERPKRCGFVSQPAHTSSSNSGETVGNGPQPPAKEANAGSHKALNSPSS